MASLTTLRIRNLVIIEDLTAEFGSGLNLLTGETGAGKSILVDALGLIVGARADRSLVRSGSDAKMWFICCTGSENGIFIIKNIGLRSILRTLFCDKL